MATPPLAYRTTRVTISGTSFSGGEEWSTGFWMGYEDGDADLPNQQLADDVRAAWQAFMTPASSYFSNVFVASLVKCSSVGTDGKASAEDTIYSTFNGTVQGGQPGAFPPQIALVATLIGTKARGVASKGRMYLPGIMAAVDGTGKILQQHQDGILTNFRTFLQAVNNSTATNNVVMLASHGSINKDGTPKVGGSAPLNKTVTNVRLGNVYDTQRRRRNGLTENYRTQSLI